MPKYCWITMLVVAPAASVLGRTLLDRLSEKEKRLFPDLTLLSDTQVQGEVLARAKAKSRRLFFWQSIRVILLLVLIVEFYRSQSILNTLLPDAVWVAPILAFILILLEYVYFSRFITSYLARESIRKHLWEEIARLGEPICSHCGYDMRTATDGICPECGKTYTPSPPHMT